MGCGSSTVGITDQDTSDKTKHNGADIVRNGHTKSVELKNAENNEKNKSVKQERRKTDPNANIDTVQSNNPAPKSVAFNIAFDENLLLKKPPRRLQKLEPLDLPKLTPEMLAEKQRIAEEKRERVRQKKKNTSQKSSKRRRELLKAKEFEQEQVQQQTSQIEDQLKLAEIKRQAKLDEVRNRQRLKAERAKRAREKAKRLNQDEPDVELEVEKDDNYNLSDDSWDERDEGSADIFGSPKKRVNTKSRIQQTASASTVDSFDQAFVRKSAAEIAAASDEFFDS